MFRSLLQSITGRRWPRFAQGQDSRPMRRRNRPGQPLSVEVLEDRLVLSTFTVRVVDQFDAEIAGSAVNVPGQGLVASGTTVALAEGEHTFSVIPKILDTDPFVHGTGLLGRTETRTIDSGTSEVHFVWPVQQVQLNLLDQFASPIVGTSGQPSAFRFSNSGLVTDGGDSVALPITDEAMLPGTLLGIWANGYDINMAPAVLDMAPGVHRLSKWEVSGTTEVTSATTDLTFAWPVEQVQFSLTDQFGNPIVGLNGQPSVFRHAQSAVGFDHGSTISLPITDEGAFATGSLIGTDVDGYNIVMAPAIIDVPALPGNSLLARSEVAGTTEVAVGTTQLTFEWITIHGLVGLVDENENEIAGSEFRFSNSGLTFPTGSCLALPVTDESVYPQLLGIWANGYDISLRPGGSSTFSSFFNVELSSAGAFTPPFVSINDASVGLRFTGSCVLEVDIDIKPNEYPNTIQLGSQGTIPVAILSSPTFDATTVDPTTVTLANAEVRLRGNGTALSSWEDVNGDGLLDLLVHVETEALELTSGDVEAVLQGQTFSGDNIQGTDTIRVVPPLRARYTAEPSTAVSLTASQAQAMLPTVIALWADAGHPTEGVGVSVAVADLPGDLLGQAAAGVITLDVNAAGLGWFLDPTPDDDAEFRIPPGEAALGAAAGSAAAGVYDLLTVLAHEYGHQLGLPHSHDEGVMAHTLPPGVRRLPAPRLPLEAGGAGLAASPAETTEAGTAEPVWTEVGVASEPIPPVEPPPLGTGVRSLVADPWVVVTSGQEAGRGLAEVAALLLPTAVPTPSLAGSAPTPIEEGLVEPAPLPVRTEEDSAVGPLWEQDRQEASTRVLDRLLAEWEVSPLEGASEWELVGDIGG